VKFRTGQVYDKGDGWAYTILSIKPQQDLIVVAEKNRSKEYENELIEVTQYSIQSLANVLRKAELEYEPDGDYYGQSELCPVCCRLAVGNKTGKAYSIVCSCGFKGQLPWATKQLHIKEISI